MRCLTSLAVLFALTLLTTSSANATAPDTLWTRILGRGTADDIIELDDHSLVAVGYGEVAGGECMRVVRTTAAGAPIWDRTYAASVSYTDARARRAFQTGDSNLLVAGTERQPGEHVLRFLKLDVATGDTIWTRVLKDVVYHEMLNSLHDALTLPNGKLIILWGGYYTRLSQLSSSCDLEWDKAYDLALDPTALSQSSDGGYFIVGSQGAYPVEANGVMLKTDASGDTLWSRIIHPGVWDELHASEGLPDGGCLAAGLSADSGWWGDDSALLICKVTAGGSLSWCRTVTSNVDGLDIELSSESGFVVAATKLDNPGSYYLVDLDLVKFDDNGFPLWNRQVGTAYDDKGMCVRETSAHDYVVSGFAKYIGCDEVNCWLDEFWLVRFGAEGVSGVPDGNQASRFRLSVYPNPVRGAGVVEIVSTLGHDEHYEIDLLDVSGRKVRQLFSGHGNAGLKTHRLETGALADGVYFVLLRAAGLSEASKLVIARR